jgi:hypothetical protein
MEKHDAIVVYVCLVSSVFDEQRAMGGRIRFFIPSTYSADTEENQDTVLVGVTTSLCVTSKCCCRRVLLSMSVGPPCSSPTAFNCAAMSFRKREFSRCIFYKSCQ